MNQDMYQNIDDDKNYDDRIIKFYSSDFAVTASIVSLSVVNLFI